MTPTQRVNVFFLLGFFAAFFGILTIFYDPEYTLVGVFGILCGAYGFFMAWRWGKLVKKPSKRKAKVSKWYPWPHTPGWMHRMTLAGWIDEMRGIKRGTRYRVIRESRQWRVVFKKSTK